MPLLVDKSGSVTVDGKIYIVGGAGNQNSRGLSVYNPTTNTIESKANMTSARMWPGVAVLNGKIYVMGGIAPGDQYPGSSFEEYNIATNHGLRSQTYSFRQVEVLLE